MQHILWRDLSNTKPLLCFFFKNLVISKKIIISALNRKLRFFPESHPTHGGTCIHLQLHLFHDTHTHHCSVTLLLRMICCDTISQTLTRIVCSQMYRLSFQVIKLIWQRRGRFSGRGLKTSLTLRACCIWRRQPKSLTTLRNFFLTWRVNSFETLSRTSWITMTLPLCPARVKPSVIWTAAASIKGCSAAWLWVLSSDSVSIDCRGWMAEPQCLRPTKMA